VAGASRCADPLRVRRLALLPLLLFLALPGTAFGQATAPADDALLITPKAFAAGGRVLVTGTGVVHLGGAQVRVNGTRTWRPRVAPGTYVARLRAHRRTVACFTVTVTGATPVAATSSGVFPVQGAYTFGDGFGVKRTGHTHQGVDVLAAEGTPLVSPVDGSVTFRKVQPSGAGHYLVIRDRDGTDYAFMHLVAGSELVERGDAVKAGQAIGKVGHTGDARGSHLHFEMWPGGWYAPGSSPVDPLPQLKAWAGSH